MARSFEGGVRVVIADVFLQLVCVISVLPCLCAIKVWLFGQSTGTAIFNCIGVWLFVLEQKADFFPSGSPTRGGPQCHGISLLNTCGILRNETSI